MAEFIEPPSSNDDQAPILIPRPQRRAIFEKLIEASKAKAVRSTRTTFVSRESAKTAHSSPSPLKFEGNGWSSYEGCMADALAPGGDEGRG